VGEAAALIHDAGASVIPNLSFVAATRRQLDDLQGILDDPEFGYLDEDTQAMWVRYNVTNRSDVERLDLRELAKYPFLRRLTLALEEQGVPLFVGTDTSLPGLFPGRSAHLELDELVKAGLTPYEALSAATRVPAAFLARHVAGAPDFGIIAPGARADLMLIEGNPLLDIRNARCIDGVVLRGRWYEVDELDELRRASSPPEPAPPTGR
jgi:imidazolonepropionase-like amidohydrolase